MATDWIASLPDRLDSFLASGGRMLSRAKAQKAIEDGLVLINDEVEHKASFRLQGGEKVTLTVSDEPVVSDIEPVDLKLEILYEDAACLVLNKPAGVAVHPGAGMVPGETTLLDGISFLFRERSLPFSPEAVLVHRLDKETTGCILIAKDPASHLALQKQFETRTVRKQYLALVAGVPDVSAAMVDSPIGRSATDRTRMSVRGVGKIRQAQTSYKIVAVNAARNAALLLCDLHTGRTHQVRVHLHAIGHPVLGDGTYRSPLADRVSEESQIGNLCLHARELMFVSPADGKGHVVKAELPAGFLDALRVIGIKWVEEKN